MDDERVAGVHQGYAGYVMGGWGAIWASVSDRARGNTPIWMCAHPRRHRAYQRALDCAEKELARLRRMEAAQQGPED